LVSLSERGFLWPFPCPFVSLVSFCGGTRPRQSATPTKKTRHPLDTKLILLYLRNCSMDTTSRWLGKRHKTRQPVRRRERARPKANRNFLPGTPRECHCKIALFPRRFCAVFKGGICYSLRHNYLQNHPPPTAQFLADVAIPDGRVSLRFTFYASRFTPCRAEAACLAEVRRRRVHVLTSPASVTHHANVTAKLRIFYTFSPSHFENTHHRPLLPNHLRKMPEKTVQFPVDFASTISPPGSHHAPFR